MIKIKYFKLRDEHINEFLEKNLVSDKGIRIFNETVMIMYEDKEHYSKGEALGVLYGQLRNLQAKRIAYEFESRYWFMRCVACKSGGTEWQEANKNDSKAKSELANTENEISSIKVFIEAVEKGEYEIK